MIKCDCGAIILNYNIHISPKVPQYGSGYTIEFMFMGQTYLFDYVIKQN